MKLKKHLTYNVGKKDIKKDWYIIDAAGKPLGKVAVKASYILRGKHKPIYTPYLDTGDNVVIINAEKALITGKKFMDKIYYHHTGYPGGLKSINYAKLLAKKPTSPMEIAIKGMLPKGPLGRKLFKNLRVYKGETHKQISQNLLKVEL
ncbi:MAG: 50S ribosomal protein L13 [Spirochaetes bacterium]|nr:50S ribosomal protein L13 [Spirochaetota bacterium]